MYPGVHCCVHFGVRRHTLWCTHWCTQAYTLVYTHKHYGVCLGVCNHCGVRRWTLWCTLWYTQPYTVVYAHEHCRMQVNTMVYAGKHWCTPLCMQAYNVVYAHEHCGVRIGVCNHTLGCMQVNTGCSEKSHQRHVNKGSEIAQKVKLQRQYNCTVTEKSHHSGKPTFSGYLILECSLHRRQ